MYYATPKWVKDAGARGAHYRFFGGRGPIRTPDGKTLPWDPDFGDPVFMAKLEKFVATLAARYDGRPEAHLSTSVPMDSGEKATPICQAA